MNAMGRKTAVRVIAVTAMTAGGLVTVGASSAAADDGGRVCMDGFPVKYRPVPGGPELSVPMCPPKRECANWMDAGTDGVVYGVDGKPLPWCDGQEPPRPREVAPSAGDPGAKTGITVRKETSRERTAREARERRERLAAETRARRERLAGRERPATTKTTAPKSGTSKPSVKITQEIGGSGGRGVAVVKCARKPTPEERAACVNAVNGGSR